MKDPYDRDIKNPQTRRAIVVAGLVKVLAKAKTRDELEAIKEWSNAVEWKEAEKLMSPEEKIRIFQLWQT